MNTVMQSESKDPMSEPPSGNEDINVKFIPREAGRHEECIWATRWKVWQNRLAI
jgi:hypothetical protein